MSKKPSPREISIRLNFTTYVTGKACKNGHKAARYTVSSDCMECVRERVRRQAAEGKEYRKHDGRWYKLQKLKG